MNKNIDWLVHNVRMDDLGQEFLGNIHTHGLSSHGHQELCIVLALGPNGGNLLNAMGMDIVCHNKKYVKGIYTDVLIDNYQIEIYSLPQDPVLYVILPDPNNKLPSDSKCEFPFNKQYEYVKIISKENARKA